MPDMTAQEHNAAVIRIAGIAEYVELMPGWNLGVRYCRPFENDADALSALRAYLQHEARDLYVVKMYLWKRAAEVDIFNRASDDNPLVAEDGATLPEAICLALEALAKTEAKP